MGLLGGVKVVCMSAYELEPLNGLYRNTYVENCIYTCAGLDSKKRREGGLGGGLKRGNSVLIGSARASSRAESISFPLSANSQSVQRLDYQPYLYIFPS